MNITLHIPDRLASRLGGTGKDLERRALEAFVLENLRAGHMTVDELREALGFQVLDEVDGFLKAHGVFEQFTVEDIDRHLETLATLDRERCDRSSPTQDPYTTWSSSKQSIFFLSCLADC